jgi:hypothetical protein
MLTSSATASGSSIRTSPVLSEEQLRLPLFREVGARTGLLIPNSTTTERLRRFLQSTMPLGTETAIADELRARRARIADELEGRVVLSVDATLGAAARIGPMHRLRFFAAMLTPFGMCPVFRPTAIEALP